MHLFARHLHLYSNQFNSNQLSSQVIGRVHVMRHLQHVLEVEVAQNSQILLPECEKEGLITTDLRTWIALGIWSGVISSDYATSEWVKSMQAYGNEGYIRFRNILERRSNSILVPSIGTLYKRIFERERKVRGEVAYRVVRKTLLVFFFGLLPI